MLHMTDFTAECWSLISDLRNQDLGFTLDYHRRCMSEHCALQCINVKYFQFHDVSSFSALQATSVEAALNPRK